VGDGGGSAERHRLVILSDQWRLVACVPEGCRIWRLDLEVEELERLRGSNGVSGGD